MGVVGLADKIGDGQLNLMNPKPAYRVSRREIVTIAQIKSIAAV
jgi:hypothetical protein